MTFFGSRKEKEREREREKDRNRDKANASAAPGGAGGNELLTGDPETDRRNVKILLDAIAAVNSSTSLEETLETVVDKAIDFTRTERGVLLFLDGAGDLSIRSARERGGKTLGSDIVISRTIPKRVLETGQPVRAVAPMEEDSLKLGTSVINLRLRAVMCVPLRHGDKHLGVIYVDSRAASREFTDSDLVLFEHLAQQLAVALDRAHLVAEKMEKDRLQRTLDEARDIQQWFMRKPLEIPGFEISAFSRSLDDTNGDYYDFVALPDGRIGIAIADVSGHGIGPALIMGRTQALLESMAEQERDLDVLFEKLNAKLRSHVEEGRYVTLFFGVLEPKGRSLAYNNAGHAPPCLFRKRTGAMESLARTGFPVGLMDSANYMHRRGLVLEPGDVLLLYTDGITEMMRPGSEELYGAERLQSALVRLAPMSPSDIIAGIEKDATGFCGGGNRQDDLTIIALKAK